MGYFEITLIDPEGESPEKVVRCHAFKIKEFAVGVIVIDHTDKGKDLGKGEVKIIILGSMQPFGYFIAKSKPLQRSNLTISD